ncbi:MAG: NADPH-dependent FMN reductase, partial [Acinetobacter sp.]
MKIYIVVGSIREGRTALKVAHWVLQEIKSYAFSTLEIEIVDLKEWDLPLFSGAHPPLTGIYDQPK